MLLIVITVAADSGSRSGRLPALLLKNRLCSPDQATETPGEYYQGPRSPAFQANLSLGRVVVLRKVAVEVECLSRWSTL